jgi:hypothetical protein
VVTMPILKDQVSLVSMHLKDEKLWI